MMVNLINEDIKSLPLKARLSVGKMLYGTLDRDVIRISKNRLIKGPCYPSELEALNYVACHTSIPVPKVHASYPTSDGKLYIEMEYIKGTDLAHVWCHDRLTKDQKDAIMKELAGFIHQLGMLKPLSPQQGKRVTSADGNHGIVDSRIGYVPFGPYDDHEDFHSFLRGHIPLGEDCTKAFSDAVTRCHSRQYETRFCHADLAARNIIIREGKVAAIVDWAFGGWYPEYWEYTKAHYGMYNVPDWYSGLEMSMPRYDEELLAEFTLWERLDEPGVKRSY